MNASAQNVIPNNDLEDWVGIDTFTSVRPNYWRTDSSAYFLSRGIPSPIFQSLNAKSGSYSLGLKSIYNHSQYKGDTIRCTFIFKGRPASLTGFYQYNKSTSSLAFINILLTARDSSNKFYILSNDSLSFNNNTSWSNFVIPIHYQTSDISYKAEIKIYFSAEKNIADSEVQFFIDRLSFSTFNEINYIPQLSVMYSQDYIQFSDLEKPSEFNLFDISGRRIYMTKPSNGYIYIGDLPAGAYIWKVLVNNREYTDKFLKQ